jgi:hypothetical protein
MGERWRRFLVELGKREAGPWEVAGRGAVVHPSTTPRGSGLRGAGKFKYIVIEVCKGGQACQPTAMPGIRFQGPKVEATISDAT